MSALMNVSLVFFLLPRWIVLHLVLPQLASCRVKAVYFLTFPVFSTVCVESWLEEGFQQCKITENELDENIFVLGFWVFFLS